VGGSTLHIVFNPSAAHGLRDALRQAGREERVVGFSDNLSFGPINPPDPGLRTRWVEEELSHTGWGEIVAETTSFWADALLTADRRVAWLSRRSAGEYAGFLEWLRRVDDEPIEVVDLTDVMLTHKDKPSGPRLAISLAILSPHQILDNDLIDRAELISSVSRAQYRELWQRLRAENAPLRVLNDGELTSAPLSFFDPLLLACARSEWRKTALIVGEALYESWEGSVFQVGDLILSARARTLAEAGHLEFRGDLSDIHNSELRLPAKQVADARAD
jgi:Protein of unknown function/Domain of unknown function (DUF1835)